MEMPGIHLAMRFAFLVGDWTSTASRPRKLNDEEWQRLTFARWASCKAPSTLMKARLNPTDLRARARRLYRQCGKLPIVIDYIQDS